MRNKDLKILAIETSCDETAAAVIFADGKKVESGPSRLTCLDWREPRRMAKPRSEKRKAEGPEIMSNVVSSQIDLHKKTGGVVPEVASRAHMEAMIPVIIEALEEAHRRKISNFKFQISNGIPDLKTKNQNLNPNALSEITHVAVTAGPGLIGSLLVGFNTAKAMAYALGVPIVPINHIEGHIYSAYAEQSPITNNQSPNKSQNLKPKNSKLKTSNFPILALTVSGGHTSLTLMRDHGNYQVIGATRDDAAGEAFDKVAKLLGLGYPGGPVVSRLAQEYRQKNPNVKIQMSNKIQSSNSKSNKANLANEANQSIILPRPMIKELNFDFSFSGLKTAVLDVVKDLSKNKKLKTKNWRPMVAAAFEDAVVDVLVTKTLRAAEKYQPKSIILAGGVAANKRLREELSHNLKPKNYNLILPAAELCGDNAAMIGIAAYYHILRGDISSWDKIKIDANLKL